MKAELIDEIENIEADCDIISKYADAIEALTTIANLDKVTTYIQINESVKIAVNFYAREVLEKLNTRY